MPGGGGGGGGGGARVDADLCLSTTDSSITADVKYTSGDTQAIASVNTGALRVCPLCVCVCV